ncbi:A24 family peptidase [Rubripirellula amarantea]|uniref:Type IV leader peptidase family protein n=1 Tax=Rubripirellula amarantea TaxID=2527999 RepID=A0A5C5WNX2_9BACT|nr:A24 family peptidase [Rubripirellula amarantea]MDA8745487.1 A24 family peptidase [Rubripirellula amarantea]TWT52524.1 Type IV leader peptidase family protein [Rubripirellula amarantea]
MKRFVLCTNPLIELWPVQFGTAVIATWMAMPLELRMSLLVVIGLLLGALANHIIYRYAYFVARPITPWASKAFLSRFQDPKVSPRSWLDRIPLLGWLRLRRESHIHGNGFWIRPLLIELSMAIVLPLLYQFEALDGGLLPTSARFARFLVLFETRGTIIFFAHAILLALMVPATFIDFDEKTIPDIITIPGTILGLIIGTVSLNVFMPTALPVGGNAVSVFPTLFDSPWFPAPNNHLTAKYWWIAMAIWTTWCFALADRRWSWAVARRRGFGRAVKHLVDGIFHYGFWKWLAAIWLIGFIGITAIYRSGGTDAWYGLFSSLVGLAVGGGIVWTIRIIASWAMNMEAMGFGDVTLMAMIGAFIGWQASLSAFFLAPFAAIVIVLVQFVITRDPHVPFGPYLCAGTLLTIVFWDKVYNGWFAFNLLTIGPILLWICIAMLGLMGVMLFVWRLIKMRLFG